MSHHAKVVYVEREPEVKPYDWKKSAGKVLKTWAVTLGSVAGLALLAFFADLDNVKRMLADVPAGAMLAPLIQGAAVWLMDYQKHKTPKGQE